MILTVKFYFYIPETHASDNDSMFPQCSSKAA